jgi:hypothetical protein
VGAGAAVSFCIDRHQQDRRVHVYDLRATFITMSLRTLESNRS